MSGWTKDTSIEVASRLIELTQTGKIVWEPSNDSPARVGEAVTPPYYTNYKDQRWRIQGEVRKNTQIVSAFPRNRQYERVNLELVDELGRTLLAVPNVPNLTTLLQVVQRQSSKADEVLEELLN